jgi:hypothetical protein
MPSNCMTFSLMPRTFSSSTTFRMSEAERPSRSIIVMMIVSPAAAFSSMAEKAGRTNALVLPLTPSSEKNSVDSVARVFDDLALVVGGLALAFGAHSDVAVHCHDFLRLRFDG